MSLVKRVGYGNTLGCDPSGGSTYTTVGSIVDGFNGPDCKAKEANTSILTDWFDSFAAVGVDPGTVTFVIAYDPAFATSHTLALLLGNGNLASWLVTYSGSSPPTESFIGFVAGMGREIKRENLITSAITIKVSGDPGFKTT